MDGVVSIIIPTYNRARYLPASLESVLGQTYGRTEVIVVNDGSDDETGAVLTPFRDRIVYLEKENGGKSSAVNLGLRHASGDYVWIFDDDDLAYPDKLERHIDLFERHPEVGFTHTSYRVFGEDGADVREVPAPVYPPEEVLRRLLLTRNFICGASVVARRSCYGRTGGFDERLVRSQDYDMWIRLARYFRAGVITEPTVKVRMHAGDRGSVLDRFPASQLGQKQHQYHRVLFKKVYDEIPLEEIFNDLEDPQGRFEALVERAWMVFKRLLVEETEADLREAEACLKAHPGVEISLAVFRFFCFAEDIAREREYREVAGLARRILDMRGLSAGGRPQVKAVWDSVEAVFGGEGCHFQTEGKGYAEAETE